MRRLDESDRLGNIGDSLDGLATVDTSPDSWLGRACAIAGRNLSREEWREYFPGREYEVSCARWQAGS